MRGLQIISDVHLESKPPRFLWRSYISPQSTHLAIVGDLCPIYDVHTWVPFLKDLSKHWSHIYWINGNHEYYGPYSTVQLLRLQEHHITRELPKVQVLNRDTHQLEHDGYTILGATLWSHVPPNHATTVHKRVNDYKYILNRDQRTVNVEETNQWHARDSQWLKNTIQHRIGENLIVLTHHAPLMKNTSDPKYSTQATSYAFASSQTALFQRHVAFWGFGHTHWPCNFRFRNTTVMSNPVGYSSEHFGLNARWRICRYDSVFVF